MMKVNVRDFPEDPVVKTLPFSVGGVGSQKLKVDQYQTAFTRRVQES